MKFRDMEKGAAAERPVGIPCFDKKGEPAELASIVAPLEGDDETLALAFAIAHASRNGVKDPKEGDPLYDVGYQAQIVASAYRDPDVGSPGQRPPTFEGGAPEVLAGLTRETITFLYAQFEDWADTCSPTRRKLSDDELMKAIRMIAAEGDDGLRFFARCGPALRWSLLRTTARQLVASLEAKSSYGTASDATPTETPKSS